MAKSVLPRHRMMLPASWIIRVLSNEPRTEHCDHCGARMFVKYASGLCPLCFNDHVPSVRGEFQRVPDALALVGVFDDPSIEEVLGTLEPYSE